MCKKLLLVGSIVLVGAWAFGSGVGREAMSYIRTGFHELRNATKDCVPLDFEIKRAENMLNNLDRTDDRLISALAGQIQSLRRMDQDVEQLQAKVADLKDEIQAWNSDLKVTLTSGGVAERESKALKLEGKFKMFKRVEAELKAKTESRDRTQERLTYIKEQREGLKGQRVELQNRIAALKTNVELLKLSETRSKTGLDHDQLAELADLKKLVDGLEERISTSLIEHQLRTEGTKEAPAPKSERGKVAPTSITAEIDSFFGNTKVAAEKK
jgi:chromosome segregation ATPase